MGSQKDIKDIFKHRYPFKLVEEKERLEDYYCYEVYITEKIKTKGRVQDFIDGILPFISYLQSSNDIKK